VYGVSDNLDLTMFHGATLVQIRIGMHELQLHFDEPKASIQLECKWELCGPGNEIVDRSQERSQSPWDRDAYRLHVCLSRHVISTEVEPPKSISLRFEGGYTLRVFDDSDEFESFHIEPGGIHV
jgi:hypothetical protein